MADVPRCRSCWAVLRFITLTSGSKLPVNPVPNQGRATHAARKAAKGYTDGVVLARGETIPPGYDGFRVHAADCSKPGAPTSRDRQSDFLPEL